MGACHAADGSLARKQYTARACAEGGAGGAAGALAGSAPNCGTAPVMPVVPVVPVMPVMSAPAAEQPSWRASQTPDVRALAAPLSPRLTQARFSSPCAALCGNSAGRVAVPLVA